MVIYIRRKTDKKYLQSVETDSWVDNAKDAYEMTYNECQSAKTVLLSTYSLDQLVEVVNPHKIKPMTEEEKQEFLNSIKK